MSYLGYVRLAAPETIVLLTSLAVLGVDLTLRGLPVRFRFSIGALVAGVGCVGAMVWLAVMPMPAGAADGMLVTGPDTQFVKQALLVLALLSILLSVESDFTEHVGEYIALILFAAEGAMLLSSAEDLLMIFVALELTSLSLYILTAFNKRNVRSAEAAMKYFLFGGLSAAFTLFGLSLVYGFAGSTNLQEIGLALGAGPLDPLLAVAMVMVVVGFGFKVAAAPFHLWAPDAYQGAPTPSAAFIASGSKVASFFIFAKVMAIGFGGFAGNAAWRGGQSGWVPVLAGLAAVSMLWGNLAALVQNSVRRLLAYSAIAHAGYLLLAVMAHSRDGQESLIYYTVTYGLTTVGAFGVVGVVERTTGGDALSDFAGLSRRAPLVGFCMLVFLLSLAGIPPLAGFFGKFYLFTAALKGGAAGFSLLWLVILAVATSAVSLYYYLQVLKQVYVSDPLTSRVVRPVSIFEQVVLCLIAAAVVVLGCAPSAILGVVQPMSQVAGR
jgi:NADH-quinone oxidoreductase subunit N